MIKRKQVKIEIDPEYINRIYGYDMREYTSILQLNELYEQTRHLKTHRAKDEMEMAIKKRALNISKKDAKQIIKNIFKEKAK